MHGCNHAFVNRYILLPKFSLAPVEVDCDKFHSASGSGSMRVRIPQPPSPPGLLGPDPGRSLSATLVACRRAAPLPSVLKTSHFAGEMGARRSILTIGRFSPIASAHLKGLHVLLDVEATLVVAPVSRRVRRLGDHKGPPDLHRDAQAYSDWLECARKQQIRLEARAQARGPYRRLEYGICNTGFVAA
jgi:hypothetical protein